jgi:hypothetical protein
MWIAYPVAKMDKSFSENWSKVEPDFFRAAPDVSRSFAVYGRPGKNVASSYRLDNTSDNVKAGYFYSMRGIGSVAILKFSSNAPKSLARPNFNSTASMLNSIGLLPAANLVTETVVFTSSPSRLQDFRFGVVSRKSNEYADDELFPRFIAAIAIERMILDLAVESLNSRFVSARRARRLMANIKFWISRPAIESVSLHETFHAIRNSLDMDRRSLEIVEALSEIIKRGNASFVAGSATTASLLALTSAPQFGVAVGVVWPLIAIGSGLAVWLFVRGLRI